MRKLIFLMFFLPAVAALGHDIYVFTQEQDKGFRLSDIGALWAKYDKESHDSWKINVKDIEKDITDLVPQSVKDAQNPLTPPKDPNAPAPDYAQEFSQMDSKDKEESVAVPSTAPSTVQEPSTIQSIIAIILEQTAALFFGGIAIFLYALNTIISKITRPKEGMNAVKKHKKGPKSGYQYNRK